MFNSFLQLGIWQFYLFMHFFMVEQIKYNQEYVLNLFVFPSDLGPGQWKTETLSDGTHQHSSWSGGEQPQSVPFLLWRG